MRKVRSELAAARLKARDEIYEQLSNLGNMGAQNADNDGHIQLDLHEMHVKYKELVEAVLPVTKKVTIIIGRGLHSEGGHSKLMIELKKKIEKNKHTRWDKIPQNAGAFVVS